MQVHGMGARVSAGAESRTVAENRTTVAMEGIELGVNKTRLHPSTRNPSTCRVLRRAWTVGRLAGRLRFPVAPNTADGTKPVNQEPGFAKQTNLWKGSIPFDWDTAHIRFGSRAAIPLGLNHVRLSPASRPADGRLDLRQRATGRRYGSAHPGRSRPLNDKPS